MSSVDSSLVLPLKAMVPSRITLIRSAIWRISGSLCEIKTIPTPVASSSCKRLNKRSVSAGVSEAVGSSRIRIRESRISPRRISTIWRSATSSDPARLCRSNWQPSAASKFFIFCMESCFFASPNRMFSFIDRLGKSSGSWGTR